MLHSKYWIKPDGSIIDCTCDEHARYALAAMLKLSPEEMHAIPLTQIFKPWQFLNKDQSWTVLLKLALRDGVTAEALGFLKEMPDKKTIDPRVFVIQHWNWIRVRKSAFYAWQWDADALKRLLSASAYWKTQRQATDDDWLELYDVTTTDSKLLTLGALKCGVKHGVPNRL